MNHHDDPKRALHKAIWLPCLTLKRDDSCQNDQCPDDNIFDIASWNNQQSCDFDTVCSASAYHTLSSQTVHCRVCKCFPSMARVSLESGETAIMSKLQIGDRVQTGMLPWYFHYQKLSLNLNSIQSSLVLLNNLLNVIYEH